MEYAIREVAIRLKNESNLRVCFYSNINLLCKLRFFRTERIQSRKPNSVSRELQSTC